MKKMNHKIEIISLFVAGIASQFAMNLIEKIIITTVAMVIGTTVAYYWKKYLESIDKKDQEQ